MSSALMPHSRISRAVRVPHLQRLRLQAALTQEDLRKLAGVSRQTVARGEAGEDIRLSSVRKLAAALKCRPLDLMEPSV